jgi:hypothetical protein
MSETYAPLFPGNWTITANAYPLPNEAFKRNNRPPGDPRDRNQQSILFMPGWQAVHKVGIVLIDGQSGLTALNMKIPSPHTRPDDKPLADVTALTAPQGALLYRIGLRVPPVSEQPGFYTSGPAGRVPSVLGPTGPAIDSGLKGTPTNMLVLASAPVTAAAAGSISGTFATTGSEPTNPLTFGGDGRLLSGAVHVTEGLGGPSPLEPLANDLTFRIYSVNAAGAAPGSAFEADLLGGVYLVAEVCYLVPAAVAGLDVVPLPGAQFAGYNG